MDNCFNCLSFSAKQSSLKKEQITYKCGQNRNVHKHIKSNSTCELFLFGQNNNPMTNPTLHRPELEKICKYFFVDINRIDKTREYNYVNARTIFVVFMFKKYYKQLIPTSTIMETVLRFYIKRDRCTFLNYLLSANEEYILRAKFMRTAWDAIFEENN